MPLPLIAAGVFAARALAKRGGGAALKKIGGAVAKRMGPVGKSIQKFAARPGVRMAAGAGAGAAAYSVAQQYGAAPAGLPAIPSSYGGVPATTGGLPRVGTLPAWRGPGGKLQLPWQDPRIPEYLKQFSLDDAYLKVSVRAPRGYVVLRDQDGKPFAVNKMIARQFRLWKPKAKPIISVRDWHSYQRAQRVEKKLRRIASKALHRRGRSSGASGGGTQRVIPFRRKAA